MGGNRSQNPRFSNDVVPRAIKYLTAEFELLTSVPVSGGEAVALTTKSPKLSKRRRVTAMKLSIPQLAKRSSHNMLYGKTASLYHEQGWNNEKDLLNKLFLLTM